MYGRQYARSKGVAKFKRRNGANIDLLMAVMGELLADMKSGPLYPLDTVDTVLRASTKVSETHESQIIKH